MDAVLVAAGASVIVGALALVGNIYGAKKAAKQTETLVVYRIDQLEKKVDKHNCVIGRMYKAEARLDVQEEQIDVANHRIDDLEKG